MKITNPYIKKLLEHYRKISLLGKANAVLNWDLNVNMPPKGALARAGQSAYITELVTNLWLEKSFRSTLEKASKLKNLNREEQAIIRNLLFAGKFYHRVPPDIIIEKEKVTSQAFVIWRKAREENEYKDFLPYLQQILELNRKIADKIGYRENPYDALLDLHEPELTAKDCEETFSKLKKELTSLLKQIKGSKNYTDKTQLISSSKKYPASDQREIGTAAIKRMGYDFEAGRLDVSAHPFTIGFDPHDVRITTRFIENDFRESFTSCMHEAGHALYEQAINPAYTDSPLEGGVSMGIHEALSRFWENMVGKNPEFLKYMFPAFQKMYKKQFGDSSGEDFVKAFNLVKPSLIRIEADEITYSLHIILRFEMENELMNGKLKAEDAAEAWREKSKELFGIMPEKDSNGILQDVHWSYGEFGYFPSYALGNLYGAQLLNTMKKTIDFDNDLSKGNLSNIHEWLNKNIHQYGSLYFPKELIKKATGEELDHRYFVEYLKKKYKKLYCL